MIFQRSWASNEHEVFPRFHAAKDVQAARGIDKRPRGVFKGQGVRGKILKGEYV